MATVAFGSSLSFLRANQNDAAQKPLLYTPNFNSLRLKQSLGSYATRRWRGVGVPRAAAEVVEDGIIAREETETEKEKDRVLRVGVICGGPSAERGISLNSARSVIDHIQVKLLHSWAFNQNAVFFKFCLDWKIETKTVRQLFPLILNQGEDLHVSCYYIDSALNAFAISPAQVGLYSLHLLTNLPELFHFSVYKVCTLTGILKHSGGFWFQTRKVS